ncbi:helix-turn-helix domain-containing protein [Conchiformibius kuhniae]|uniref:Helix-turn-helix domain-containing protein n=1 Tax=Conchiformibius kuhniae TaxID=211502 RepID=A0A8T9MUD7_9NEIS|nr:helix-turn-helix transcriptional regulator [Conchiformibius kuhniae]UOP04899.1 helix-turn-helix domain-containing protein [Conchiformibius kuhniae]
MTPILENPDAVSRRIGQAIARRRRASGHTQEHIAEMLNIGSETVSRIERGLIVPNILRLLEFAQLFDCTVYDFLSDSMPAPLPASANPAAHRLAQLLDGLDANDCELLLDFAAAFATRLKRAQT